MSGDLTSFDVIDGRSLWAVPQGERPELRAAQIGRRSVPAESTYLGAFSEQDNPIKNKESDRTQSSDKGSQSTSCCAPSEQSGERMRLTNPKAMI